jgi:hypothetical protein
MTPASYTSRYDEGGEQVRPDSRLSARVLQTVASAGRPTDAQRRMIEEYARESRQSAGFLVQEPQLGMRAYELEPADDLYAGAPYPSLSSSRLQDARVANPMMPGVLQSAQYQQARAPVSVQSAPNQAGRAQVSVQSAPPPQGRVQVSAPVQAQTGVQRPESSLSSVEEDQGMFSALFQALALTADQPRAGAGAVEKVKPPPPDKKDEEIERLWRENQQMKQYIAELQSEAETHGKALHSTLARLPYENGFGSDFAEFRREMVHCVHQLFMAIPVYADLARNGNGTEKDKVLHHLVFHVLKETRFVVKTEDFFRASDSLTDQKELQPYNIPDDLTPKKFSVITIGYFFNVTDKVAFEILCHIASCLGKVMPRLKSSETAALRKYCSFVFSMGHDEDLLKKIQEEDKKYNTMAVEQFKASVEDVEKPNLKSDIHGSRFTTEYGCLYPAFSSFGGQDSQQYV